MAFPENWTQVRVKGRYVLPTGNPARGTIVFKVYPFSRILNSTDNTIVVPEDIKVELDGNGEFSIMLPSTNDPAIRPHFRWHVRERFLPNKRFSYLIEVPYDEDDRKSTC